MPCRWRNGPISAIFALPVDKEISYTKELEVAKHQADQDLKDILLAYQDYAQVRFVDDTNAITARGWFLVLLHLLLPAFIGFKVDPSPLWSWKSIGSDTHSNPQSAHAFDPLGSVCHLPRRRFERIRALLELLP